ncbi:hypothetical protein [Clostridium saccharobutylicum]|nr:hypothetical protein [Clostridium saccharobutylicum]AQR88627.1 hypothetical protein CLOSC_02890 [Clostridium saccharobutylicum]AQR98525.1 hypothetical protein CSACC_02890 [Clostridium saccharobutylicum]AQS08239.1 hypothetical protein CLOBY_03090 [Clostridium saccharobutylicum]AQS12515.1 hypothetical protein CLOSACC_02890 [Clostridium saccharobutylicum]MBA2907854.1 lysylphosphatidylglycerol synthetase-like protein (DUF2156 family) [Clostridium saccharobutylicum]
MENSQSQKLGAGIIIISIIYIILCIASIFGTVVLLTQKASLTKQGITLPLTNAQMTISLILQLLLLIAIILILFKKSIGVYSYFLLIILDLINTIMDSGFKWTIILSLILPILMAICINRKRKPFNL